MTDMIRKSGNGLKNFEVVKGILVTGGIDAFDGRMIFVRTAFKEVFVSFKRQLCESDKKNDWQILRR